MTYKLDARFPLRVVSEVSAMLRLKVWIETGTGCGHTTGAMSALFRETHTIELHHETAVRARETLRPCVNATVHEGASENLLPPLLRQLQDEPMFLWLDGHYSGEGTALGETECPVLAELAATDLCRNQFVVGIDDARFFENTPPPPHKASDWPTVAQILAAGNTFGRRWYKANDALFWLPMNDWVKAWAFNLEQTGLLTPIS